MSTKLCVGNLPHDASKDSIRDVFSECGHVAEVEIVLEKGNRRSRGIAFVTMESPGVANNAIEVLDGRMFDGRPLRVSLAAGQTRTSNTEARREETRAARITQQFQERGNMAYDLECGGEALTVRVFEHDATGWRIEARTRRANAEGITVSASAQTRAEALREVAASWQAKSVTSGLPPFDWVAIGRALSAVRAI